MAPFLGFIGHKAANHVIGKRIDLGLGQALFRDRRVSVAVKMEAAVIALALTGLLFLLELPLESVLALLVPFGGLGLDMMIDGAELFIVPVLIGLALLPYLTPKALLARIRAERAQSIPHVIA